MLSYAQLAGAVILDVAGRLQDKPPRLGLSNPPWPLALLPLHHGSTQGPAPHHAATPRDLGSQSRRPSCLMNTLQQPESTASEHP